jgi:tRNA threonylcarbamoyladenosine biosynthesis protein TsaB
MIVLVIKTDNPQAEIGVFDNQTKLAYKTWEAHKRLAETIHQTIDEVLAEAGKKLEDLQGVVVYEGPGSFTGLRIGITVANTIAYSLHIPIVASKEERWIETGINRLHAGEQDEVALPFYGRDAHITTQRK